MNISKRTFDLALEFMYGCEVSLAEIMLNYVGLLAIATYLDLPLLSEAVVEGVVQSIDEENVACIFNDITTLAEVNEAGNQILEACHTFLKSEVFTMVYNPLNTSFEDISRLMNYPVEVIISLLSSNSLYVPSEWTRCLLFERFYWAVADLVNAENADTPMDDGNSDDIDHEVLGDGNYDAVDHEGLENGNCDDVDQEDLEVLGKIQDALNNGVCFCHIPFRRLKYAMDTMKNIFGEPLLYEATLQKHHWLAEELKCCILDCPADEQEAGLTISMDDEEEVDLQDGAMPPFRFAVEFKNISRLGDRARVKSPLVFYGGSYWYLALSGPQYLHENGCYLRREQDFIGNSITNITSKIVTTMDEPIEVDCNGVSNPGKETVLRGDYVDIRKPFAFVKFHVTGVPHPETCNGVPTHYFGSQSEWGCVPFSVENISTKYDSLKVVVNIALA